MGKLEPKRLIGLILILAASAFLIAATWLAPAVNRSQCVGCGDCAAICPTGSITIVRGKAVIDDASCIRCDNCVRACPYNAINGKDRRY